MPVFHNIMCANAITIKEILINSKITERYMLFFKDRIKLNDKDRTELHRIM